MTFAYYNEIESYAAQWLRNLIAKGLIADGEVDTRSIVDVRPADLAGFDQCHFFAGIGGWSHALRLAEWPDDRPVWTGSCPCQPFSVAGKGAGTDDPRHLWPHFHLLIAACRPPIVLGEQVAGKAGYGWFDGVRADLEREGYASRGVDIPALAVDAPHVRQRLYWVALDVADAQSIGREERERQDGQQDTRSGSQGRVDAAGTDKGNVADADIFRSFTQPIRVHREMEGTVERKESAGDQSAIRSASCSANGSFWSDAVWLTGSDGKARRSQPGLPLLAYGVSNRVGRLRAYGNAIVPQVAAEVIKAVMETEL